MINEAHTILLLHSKVLYSTMWELNSFLPYQEVAVLIQSHAKFALYFLDGIQRNMNIQLNKQSFVLGNIEPDFPFVFPTVKHYKQSNHDFIYSLIKDLYEYNCNGNFLSLAKLSEKLGIINHYICDYFCRPHFDRDYYSSHLVEHLSYEKDLHRYLNTSYSFSDNEDAYSKTLPLEGIFPFIEERLFEYDNREMGFQTDIDFALSTVSAINSTILSNLVFENYVLSLSTL